MTTPHFSIVLPAYNAAASVAATIASVLAQTDGDFELILIDDGSTDATLATLMAAAAGDTRIRLVAQANAGVAAARNLGLSLAHGVLVAFIDADDIWHPEKLARHRAHHALYPLDGISFARIAFLEAGMAGLDGARTQSTVPPGALTIADLIGENPVCTASNIVVTRRCAVAVGGYLAGMTHAEDQEWLARVVAAGFGVRGIDELLVGYRLSPSGLSCDLNRMYAGWRRLARRYRGAIDMAAAEAVYCRYLARRALRSGDRSRMARGFALRGVACDRTAFFADRRRGGLTFAGALLGPLIPVRLRTRLFA